VLVGLGSRVQPQTGNTIRLNHTAMFTVMHVHFRLKEMCPVLMGYFSTIDDDGGDNQMSAEDVLTWANLDGHIIMEDQDMLNS
jgi:hypothetical protein